MATKYTPLFLAAFLGGVALRSFFVIPIFIIFTFLGIVIGALLLGWFTKSFTPVHRAVAFAFVFILLGSLRFSFFENTISHDQLHRFSGHEIALRGTVLSTALKPNSQRVVFSTEKGKALLVTNLYPRYKYGDILNVKGIVKEPEAYGAFDTKQILARDQIFSEILFPQVEIVGFHPPHAALYYLYLLRDVFEENIRVTLPEPHASLANGMLLGDEGALDKNITDTFRKSGTIHILVLSGYNITIVGIFIMALLGAVFPQSVAWFGSVLGIVAFTAMTGGQAPAVRSAIMALIGLVAAKTGRLRAVSLALLWAAFLMIVWNPMTLRWDRGFQLSFLATLGLMVASPIIKQKLSWVPEAWGMRESGASTLAAQLFVVPLLLSWGSEISFLSPIANILIVGLVPIVMFFSFLGGLAAFGSIVLGKWIGAVAYILISFQLFVAEEIASIPASSIVFNGVPSAIIVSIYGLLFYWAIQFYIKVKV